MAGASPLLEDSAATPTSIALNPKLPVYPTLYTLSSTPFLVLIPTSSQRGRKSSFSISRALWEHFDGDRWHRSMRAHRLERLLSITFNYYQLLSITTALSRKRPRPSRLPTCRALDKKGESPVRPIKRATESKPMKRPTCISVLPLLFYSQA